MKINTSLLALTVITTSVTLAACQSNDSPESLDSSAAAPAADYCQTEVIDRDGVCRKKDGILPPTIIIEYPPQLVWDEGNWDDDVWQ